MLKIFTNTKLLTFLLLFASGIFMSACDKDDDGVNSSEVELLSFGPSGVQHGENISFIGKNLDKVNSIKLPGVSEPISSFVEHTSEHIILKVPAEATEGKVMLVTSEKEIESKTILSFEVPVTINSIPAEAKPGTTITITGNFVNWIKSVTFSESIVVTEFESTSLTELVVRVPMAAKTGMLQFSTGGTKPLQINQEDELVVTTPTITSLSPMSIRHTESLKISGTDLDLVTKITFPGGTVLDVFESQTETEIVVKVPSNAVDGALTFEVPSGVIFESESSISIILPNVTAFSPSDPASHIGGVELTMTGTNLDLVEKIFFPGVPDAVTSFLDHTSNQIVLVIPEGVQGGTVSLKTIHDYTVPVAVPFGNQLELSLAVFDDAPRNGFGTWGGWGGGSFDATSTENPRLGTVSVKVTYAGDWGAGPQFGGSSISTDGMGSFAFSIYGGPGTDGKNINVIVKSSTGEGSKQVTFVEGEWTDVQIPLSDLGSPANVTEVAFQDTGFSGEVYIDHIGLR